VPFPQPVTLSTRRKCISIPNLPPIHKEFTVNSLDAGALPTYLLYAGSGSERLLDR
jgi:hypothetical protein